jgi:hypothetical protein
MNESEQLSSQAKSLLNAAGFSGKILSIKSCVHGGNNRTYRLETEDGLFALKKYFREASDKRDRLATEFAFLSYANSVAPKMTPRPYALDSESGSALYEFIEGNPLSATEIGEQEVKWAAEFFCALNQAQKKTLAASLPIASEACFTIEEHLAIISKRIDALQQIIPESPEDKLAEEVIQQLHARWKILSQQVNHAAERGGIKPCKVLDSEDRCISPSDFGFHNALRMKDGSIRFIDFEYAGWDDPAKMVGDFFSQLAIPVPAEYFTDFNQAVMKPFPAASHLMLRAKLLRSVYQVKWCCIALNVFIPVNLARRKFANPELNVVDLKKAQLSKAVSLLQRLEVENYV